MHHPTVAPLPRVRVRGLALAAALLGLLVSLAGPAATARAAAYQYWGYWQVSGGAWAFAPKGPDQTTPAEGAVEGWRFAVADENSTRMPRVLPTFTQLCGSTPAQDGRKRVGLVIDFGRTADGDGTTTPPALVATCALVPTAATGSQVLAVAGSVRVDKGLVCAIAGYPATGCGGAVATLSEAQKAADTPLALPTPTPSATAAASTATAATQDTGTNFSPILWLAIAVAIGAAFVAMRRRPSGT